VKGGKGFGANKIVKVRGLGKGEGTLANAECLARAQNSGKAKRGKKGHSSFQ